MKTTTTILNKLSYKLAQFSRYITWLVLRYTSNDCEQYVDRQKSDIIDNRKAYSKAIKDFYAKKTKLL
jgi:hypothetical protein